jgi:hypothetical protein
MYIKPTANIVFNGKKTETISHKIWNETSVSTIPTLIQYSFGIPTRAIRQVEEIEGIQIGKETVKISLFVHDMIIYLKDPKNSTLKLLDTMNSYTQVA